MQGSDNQGSDGQYLMLPRGIGSFETIDSSTFNESFERLRNQGQALCIRNVVSVQIHLVAQ